jgi:fibro-slime domain-containing protein
MKLPTLETKCAGSRCHGHGNECTSGRLLLPRGAGLLLLVVLPAAACAPIDRGAAGRTSNDAGGGLPGGPGSDPRGTLGIGDPTQSCGRTLRAVTRDFRGWTGPAGEPKHPDFENVVSDDKGIVGAMLGADDKPVYAHGTGRTTTTTGQTAFDQWYRDVGGVNERFEIALPLTEDASRAGTFLYDSDAYFPIDDRGFGNQFQAHNFSFTSELHFNFPYRGGEQFTFRGDDDVWLFVNGRLAIDLGGVHAAETGTVSLDQRAAELGIAPQNTYRMDIFQAERHTSGSTFHVETTLQCIDNVIIP